MALKAGNDSINVVWQSGSVSLTAIVVIVFDQGKPRKSFFAMSENVKRDFIFTWQIKGK